MSLLDIYSLFSQNVVFSSSLKRELSSIERTWCVCNIFLGDGEEFQMEHLLHAHAFAMSFKPPLEVTSPLDSTPPWPCHFEQSLTLGHIREYA
jgi:hypothetical protein